jgi:PAS domain S-box-containing protein
MMATPESLASKALILASHGRDGEIARALLAEANIQSAACADLGSFQRALGDEAFFAVVTEEDMSTADMRGVADWIERQPSWSDLPFIVLTRGGGGPERNPTADRLSQILGNVSFLERPFHPTTFISVARSALKGRARQFEARARIAELHEGEQRLRIALMAGRLGSWELDLSSMTLTASAASKAHFGRGQEDPFNYHHVVSGVHPDDLGRVKEAVRFIQDKYYDGSVEFRTVWPDDSVHWAEVRARLVQNKAGNKVLIGVSSDVTARKKAEESLRNLNETLEERVAARTAELERTHKIVLSEIAQRERAEEQLRQAQKMEMIGQLTGGVAHDFNNLLMAVIGNLDLLRRRIPSDPKLVRFIDGALQGARRGASLTQRLLAFARQQDLKTEPRDLAELVRGMVDLLERSVGSQIELEFKLPPSVPSTLVDANQIELALLNLVVNARDAMPDGGKLSISVNLATGRQPDELAPGLYVLLVVTDTGHGMDADILKKAIQPFFSTKELGKGTGLGLSMTHGLALQLGGSLRLTSEVGRGTRAELWLPATLKEGTMKMSSTPEAAVNIAPQRAVVLFVDDDSLIGMSTVDMLEDLGHEVIGVDSGAQALDVLRDGRKIDLLITDFSMPKMNGAQLAKAARQLRPELPILIATGYAELPQEAEIDIPRLGKPYQQDQLAAAIAKVLRCRLGQ